MSKITEEEVMKAIKKCHWRTDVGGIPICAGECVLCEKAISRGTCDTLKKLFKAKEGNINDE